MNADAAAAAARAAGFSTAVLGVAVLSAPRRLAAISGVRHASTLRVIGIADVLLAPGLIAGRRKRGWLIARAVANGVSAGLLARERGPMARTVAAALAALIVLDLKAASALRGHVGR